MDPFPFDDYKDVLRAAIKAASGKRGYQGAMAAAAGCKSSYLSQVLSGPAHLTPDHGIGVAEFLGLADLASDYFLNLLHAARAATPKLKARLSAQRMTLKKQRDDLMARFAGARPPDVTAEGATRYYSHWRYAALHLMLGIPALQTPAALAPRLGLSVRKTQEMLESLAAMSLAALEGGRWVPRDNNLHLPKGSVMANVSHANWRMRSVQRVQEEDRGDDLFYTGVHTLSRQDLSKVKEILRDSLARARAVIGPSKEEEAVCIICDCFVI